MDKSKIISLVALLVLVIALPVYGFMEKGRYAECQGSPRRSVHDGRN